MSESNLEQRILAVEVAVRELQNAIQQTAPHWLDNVIGSMRDEPAFEEVLAYGREIRNENQPPANGAS